VSYPTCEGGITAGRVSFSSQAAPLSGSLSWDNQPVAQEGAISASLDIVFTRDSELEQPMTVCIPPLPQWANNDKLLQRTCLAALRADQSYACDERSIQVVDDLVCASTSREGRFALLVVDDLRASAPSMASPAIYLVVVLALSVLLPTLL